MFLEEQKGSADISPKSAEAELADDWFWRPVKRHHTEFVPKQQTASSWRELGRAMQLADRLSLQSTREQSGQTLKYLHNTVRKK